MRSLHQYQWMSNRIWKVFAKDLLSVLSTYLMYNVMKTREKYISSCYRDDAVSFQRMHQVYDNECAENPVLIECWQIAELNQYDSW